MDVYTLTVVHIPVDGESNVISYAFPTKDEALRAASNEEDLWLKKCEIVTKKVTFNGKRMAYKKWIKDNLVSIERYKPANAVFFKHYQLNRNKEIDNPEFEQKIIMVQDMTINAFECA